MTVLPAERGTRDKARTRNAILEAAATMISAHGRSVSLAAIAESAGVSKGALTHHFASRRELEEARLVDAVERLKTEVYASVDISENRPGKLLRGYIRAMTSGSAVMRELFSPGSLLLSLGTDMSLGEVIARDAETVSTIPLR